MRLVDFFAVSTFLLSALQAVTAAEYREGEDNFDFKTEIKDALSNGFTIEYKKYYKVVTNLITNKRYCLIGWDQAVPSDCTRESSFSIPVQRFSFESDSISIGPFIELLNLQDKIATPVRAESTTSPCVISGSNNSNNTKAPDITFSGRDENFHVSFSGHSDTLTPLKKASWLLYIGAFFDIEAEAFAAYSQIEASYECHKRNLGTVNYPKGIAWTTYNPTAKIYTINGDAYYDQLSQDAGGALRTNNRLQDHTFTNSPNDLFLLGLALGSVPYIIDTSDVNVTYKSWYESGGIYFQDGKTHTVVKAIQDKKVYTMHGRVNSFGVSDWVQRSAARPDLALLDLIKLLYPDAKVEDETIFPIWLSSFEKVTEERRVINDGNYGNCTNMIGTAAHESKCYLAQGDSNSVHQPDLSSGGKAGISVGVILFVIISACVGTWLFRRHRRNQRHNFYRMNDLQ